MEKHRTALGNDMGTLADDARALLAATGDVASDKVTEARKRLAATLENGRQIFGRVREKAVQSTQAADQTVREHPYEAMGIALGIGVILGFLAARQCGRN
jgi:ElaB/YqjD/DUF883 family membrane-anchored ribosome-binding protein